MAGRGVDVDHTTLNRWVVRYAPQIADQAQNRKRPTLRSWHVDETYIKVKGQWTYLYRAVDHDGQTLDLCFPNDAISVLHGASLKKPSQNGVPEKIVIDKSGANLAGAQAVNNILKSTGHSKIIKILQIKYLNNILERDHQFIKRITKHILGFKAFHSASATIAGIEVAHMIRKSQFANGNRSPFDVFAELAA